MTYVDTAITIQAVRLLVADLMRHVDLCSGIGGFAYAFQTVELSKPVLFCDIEPWSRKVLAKHWPDVPIAHDVKELANDPARLVPDCDILTAGYPCQPFSVAGKQRGTEDDRHIWPFIGQIIAHKRPAYCVLENVYGHVALGLDQVLADLEAQDYATRAFIVPACGVNAPHRRDRLWIIAHTNSYGEPDGTINEKQGCGKLVGNAAHNGCIGWGKADGREGQTHQLQQQSGVWCEPVRPSEDVADTDSARQQQSHQKVERRASEQPDSRSFQPRKNVADTDNEGLQGRLSGRQDAQWQGEHGHAGCSGTAHRQPAKDWCAVESRICHLVDGLPKGLDRFDGWEREPADIPRVATGVKDRVSRLKGLGNAIVPQIAMQIGLTIKALRDE